MKLFAGVLDIFGSRLKTVGSFRIVWQRCGSRFSSRSRSVFLCFPVSFVLFAVLCLLCRFRMLQDEFLWAVRNSEELTVSDLVRSQSAVFGNGDAGLVGTCYACYASMPIFSNLLESASGFASTLRMNGCSSSSTPLFSSWRRSDTEFTWIHSLMLMFDYAVDVRYSYAILDAPYISLY